MTDERLLFIASCPRCIHHHPSNVEVLCELIAFEMDVAQRQSDAFWEAVLPQPTEPQITRGSWWS